MACWVLLILQPGKGSTVALDSLEFQDSCTECKSAFIPFLPILLCSLPLSHVLFFVRISGMAHKSCAVITWYLHEFLGCHLFSLLLFVPHKSAYWKVVSEVSQSIQINTQLSIKLPKFEFAIHNIFFSNFLAVWAESRVTPICFVACHDPATLRAKQLSLVFESQCL